MPIADLLKEEDLKGFANSMETLYNHPKWGKTCKEMLSEVFEVTIPEYEHEKALDAERAKLRDDVESLRSEQEAEKIRQKVQAKRQEVIDKGVVKRDEMPEVEKLMVERGIGDYQTAAEFYKGQKQLATPTADIMERTALTLPNEVELFKNPQQWARKTAYAAVNDLERQRRQAA